MFNSTLQHTATKITLKFRPADVTVEGTRYPLNVAGIYLSLLVKCDTLRIYVELESSYEAEWCVSCRYINKDDSLSAESKYTGVLTKLVCPRAALNSPSLQEKDGWLGADGCLTFELTVSRPSADVMRNLGAQSDLIDNLFRYANKVKNLTVCSRDGKEYEINEQIFACHSEPLATFLKYKEDGRITFKDIKSNVMDEFIFYLKNGLINKSATSVVFDLAELAHLYELPKLFELVEPHFVDQVRSGQLRRVMKIAKRFNSNRLFEAIGKIEKVSEELLSGESEDFTVEVQGETLSINQAFLALKYPYLESQKEKMTTVLQGTTLRAAKGVIGFLKTSQVDGLSECLSEYASLAKALHLPDLISLVEQEAICNISKYNRDDVIDLAESLISVKIFRALAAPR